MKRRELLIGGLAGAAAVAALPKIAVGEGPRREPKRVLKFDFPGEAKGCTSSTQSNPTWGDGIIHAVEFSGPVAALLRAYFSLFVFGEEAENSFWGRKAKVMLQTPVWYLPHGIAEYVAEIGTNGTAGPIYLMKPIAYRHGFGATISQTETVPGTIEARLHLS